MCLTLFSSRGEAARQCAAGRGEDLPRSGRLGNYFDNNPLSHPRSVVRIAVSAASFTMVGTHRDRSIAMPVTFEIFTDYV
jgi:hypothetical protein